MTRSEKRISLFILALVLALFGATGASAAVDACMKCHDAEGFKGKVVHEPVASRKCHNCHNPHASRYGALLHKEPPALCYLCHGELQGRIEKAKVLHEPVRKGECSGCHQPHKADEQGLLLDRVPALCFECHQQLQEQKVAHSHRPFARGECLTCHSSHGTDEPGLLRGNDPGLCLKCHSETAGMTKAHLGRSLGNMKCLGCHSGHGSANRGLIRDQLHSPFADKDCGICHNASDKGPALCFSCHDGIQDSFNFAHNHMVPGYGNVCLTCHNAHASDSEKMLAGRQFQVCTGCHEDTYEKRAEALYVHPKWEGLCTECHQAHGSNELGLLRGDGNQVCEKCHETQGKFVHPIGEKVVDPRNRQMVTCVTCHNTHGTPFKFNLRLSGEKDLCVQCHKSY